MGDIDFEAALRIEGSDSGHHGRVIRGDLDRLTALSTVQVAVLDERQDVELLAAVGPVTVAQDTEVLEDIQGPIDRRWDGAGVQCPAALDELGARHVTIGLSEDLDQDPALRGPAQAAGTEAVRDTGPR